MELDFIFFPGINGPLKKLREGDIVWIPKNQNFKESDKLPLSDLIEEEIEELDETIQNKMESLNMRNNINTASKQLTFVKENIQQQLQEKQKNLQFKPQSYNFEKNILSNQSSLIDNELVNCNSSGFQSDLKYKTDEFENLQPRDDSQTTINENLASEIQVQQNSLPKFQLLRQLINNDSFNYKNNNNNLNIISDSIPCLFLDSNVGSQRLLIYFHGNGEEISQSFELLNHLRKHLLINVLAVEYPNYGVYKSEKCELNQVLENSIQVYDYLVNIIGFQEQNIIILGRSIGSGPSIYLSSLRNPGALALISAFASLKSVVRDYAGNIFQYFIKERMDNQNNIKHTQCPVFLLHGKKDTLIPFSHSVSLKENCKKYCELHLPEEMNHVQLDFFFDLTINLKKFLLQIQFMKFNELYPQNNNAKIQQNQKFQNTIIMPKNGYYQEIKQMQQLIQIEDQMKSILKQNI